MANELRENQRVRFNANAAWLRGSNGEFATVTRISRECVHLRLDNGQLVGPWHHGYLKAVSKFVEGDRVRMRTVSGRLGNVVSVDDEMSLVRVAFDGHATNNAVCIPRKPPRICGAGSDVQATRLGIDWRYAQRSDCGAHNTRRWFADHVRRTRQQHRKALRCEGAGLGGDDTRRTGYTQACACTQAAFVRLQRWPARRDQVEQRGLHRRSAHVEPSNRSHVQGAHGRWITAQHRRGSPRQVLVQGGEKVWDPERVGCEVVSHACNKVVVSYGVGSMRKVWFEFQVTPWGDVPAQAKAKAKAKATPDATLIAEFNKTKQELATALEALSNAARSRDEWKTTSEENAARRKEYSDESKRLQEDVSLLKEQVAVLKPIVITGMPVKLDMTTPAKSGPVCSSIAIQLNTGAGVIDISAKTINIDDIKAIRDLYHAQAKRSGMITVTLAAR